MTAALRLLCLKLPIGHCLRLVSLGLTCLSLDTAIAADSTSPPRLPMAGDFQLDGERWTYREGDFTVSGILLKPPGKGPFPAVLISHGMGGSAQSFGLTKAREMVQWGLVCIAPDYTHAGNLRGAPNPSARPSNLGASPENLRRARTCLDILRSLPEVDPAQLFAYGHSMGGFVTIGLAASSPELLKAAAITASGVAPQDGYPAPSVTTAEKIRTPFLMLHGDQDTVVRPAQSEALKKVLDQQNVPNDRLIADGHGHPIDQTLRADVYRLIREWFEQHGLRRP